jgi:hypothetical protein
MRVNIEFMKPRLSLLLIAPLLALLLAGCSQSSKDAPAVAAPDKAPPAEEEAGPHVSRGADGQVIITISDEAQGQLGLVVKKPEPFQMSPEVKAFGRALDPAPLAALLNELAAARAAYTASSNELARLKTLAGQGNASARALQAVEAAAQRDQLSVQSGTDRLSLAWGKAVTEQPDLPTFIQSVTSLETVLVRVDVPMGETLPAPPVGARLITVSGDSLEATFLGHASNVDPQMQGRGFLFLVKPNKSRLAPGEAVTAYLKLPGEPVPGVIMPREAVVRAEGAGWVYRLNPGGEGFARIEIALKHPTEAGWFITKGVTANDYVVVTGAQQLLSLELKGQGGE